MDALSNRAARRIAASVVIAVLVACTRDGGTAPPPPPPPRLSEADSLAVTDLVGDALLRLEGSTEPAIVAVRRTLLTALAAVVQRDATRTRRAVEEAATGLATVGDDPEHAAAALNLDALRARLDAP